jgi:gluconate 2-dehydrogenase gamma chain
VLKAHSEGSERELRQRGLSRRELLRRAGILGVAATAPAGLGAQEAGAKEIVVQRAALEVLSPAEADALEAVLARLVPADALGPGAVEMGVGTYIDRALAGALKTDLASYQRNLAALDAHAQRTYGGVYARLTTAQQDTLLTQMQANTLPGFTPDARTFFNLVKEHSLQGMFGDPYWGGNKNGSGWRLIGFPGISLDIKAHDQAVNATRYRSQYRKSTYDWDQFKRKKA